MIVRITTGVSVNLIFKLFQIGLFCTCCIKANLSLENTPDNIKYSTRANKGRSILEAAPLRIQAKTHFLCVFYVITLGLKK